MKTLYIECKMGAAGDMLMAALSELLPDPEGFVEKLNKLKIPGVEISRSPASKCGVAGTQISVRIGGAEEESFDLPAGHEHEQGRSGAQRHGGHGHHHSDMAEISDILESLPISEAVRSAARAVYEIIAEAEAKAHGVPVKAVHFHEVGMMDAVADIVGVCMAIEELAPGRIIASPVHVGSGFVRCAHGVLPVPAPATAHILEGIPSYGGEIAGELCTPTGAALLKHFADEFGDMPPMESVRIGCGMGKKDFPVANCVRVFLGEAAEQA